MGVGKTIQALGLATCLQQKWPLLIITPSSLRLNWKLEIMEWIKFIKECNILIIDKQTSKFYEENIKIVIISYELCKQYNNYLKTFKIAIADEAHYLKNYQAQRSQLLIPILQNMHHIILLTGTPALAKPKELYNLLSIIRPDIFKFPKSFLERYCDPKPNPFYENKIDYEGASNCDELHFILKNNFMIRRLKQDVLTELPLKRRRKVVVKTDIKKMDWTPAIMQQAEDRAHRVGQIGCVECFYLIGENTLDQYIYDKLNRKSNIVQSIIDGQSSNNFSLQQLEFQSNQKQEKIIENKSTVQKKKFIDEYFDKFKYRKKQIMSTIIEQPKQIQFDIQSKGIQRLKMCDGLSNYNQQLQYNAEKLIEDFPQKDKALLIKLLEDVENRLDVAYEILYSEQISIENQYQNRNENKQEFNFEKAPQEVIKERKIINNVQMKQLKQNKQNNLAQFKQQQQQQQNSQKLKDINEIDNFQKQLVLDNIIPIILNRITSCNYDQAMVLLIEAFKHYEEENRKAIKYDKIITNHNILLKTIINQQIKIQKYDKLQKELEAENIQLIKDKEKYKSKSERITLMFNAQNQKYSYENYDDFDQNNNGGNSMCF
ncbi:hypothetical protein IMG5_107420 [Ichthyophthirius multifiliis]|uniref:Helicase ATP-binding domain-containing protein n=1 Tax=Ichthyophthirius multifiliis TaxID=5932 RepID=G0QTE6_ICHMU|nr:hypothetical protein IMG5_107420 [Ichthyophthirius multifiliis]EGR31523.1 hypothetical protein IMG5_107420 [Ichthyophthirius multifiliis]|eukprot:XP_004035009.1 hypothetical protein IMG5_107420 [Ichthyophthirius multifiliis]